MYMCLEWNKNKNEKKRKQFEKKNERFYFNLKWTKK